MRSPDKLQTLSYVLLPVLLDTDAGGSTNYANSSATWSHERNSAVLLVMHIMFLALPAPFCLIWLLMPQSQRWSTTFNQLVRLEMVNINDRKHWTFPQPTDGMFCRELPKYLLELHAERRPLSRIEYSDVYSACSRFQFPSYINNTH